MLAFALSLALIADPPKAAEKTAPKAAPPAAKVAPPAAKAAKVADQPLHVKGFILLKLGAPTTFLGSPLDAINDLASSAINDALAKTGCELNPGMSLKPIFTQGDPKAPNRVLLAFDIAVTAGSKASAETFARALCEELDRILQELAADDYDRAKLRSNSMDNEVQRCRQEEDKLASMLDAATRALTPEQCESLIAEKAREREAAERAVESARHRLRSLAEHRAKAGNEGGGDPSIALALAEARVEVAKLAATHGVDHPLMRAATNRVQELEKAALSKLAQNDAPKDSPRAELARRALEMQLMESDAALALKYAATDKDLERLGQQIDVLRQRQDVRRRRAALEDEAARTMRLERPEVGVRILRLQAVP